MIARGGSGFVGVAAVVCLVSAARPADAARGAEAAAQEAIKKAAADFAATDYATAVARLDKAARTCAAKHCTRATRAFVLRDLGTMQFRMGDKPAAANSFSEALALAPDLALNPKYGAPDLQAAWDQARAAAGTVAAPKDEPPTGDFTHTPPAEQRANTPIPLYFEYPGDSPPARVVLKYRGQRMTEWASVELSATDGGWAGTIPCGDVVRGTMQYWLQGSDENGEPVASAGDPKHAYSVPIRERIAGEGPHLPDQPPPSTCTEVPSSGGEGGAAPRFWLGVVGTIDFVSMPEATDACKLTQAGIPANAAALYCTTPDGADFPTRSLPAGPVENAALVPGQAGRVGGGLQSGDVRLMVSLDYALRPNILVGGRLGYVFNAYPADAASKDGRAAGFRVHVEARTTYLFGAADPLARGGFAPLAFGGFGLAEFDVHSGTAVALVNARALQSVDVWRTDGPGFLLLGGGVRYQFSPRAAVTGAFRLNLAFGNDVLVTYGPEVGVAYGF